MSQIGALAADERRVTAEEPGGPLSCRNEKFGVRIESGRNLVFLLF